MGRLCSAPPCRTVLFLTMTLRGQVDSMPSGVAAGSCSPNPLPSLGLASPGRRPVAVPGRVLLLGLGVDNFWLSKSGLGAINPVLPMSTI